MTTFSKNLEGGYGPFGPPPAYPYDLKRQNYWQSQYLLFSTTNKRYTAFYSASLQPPIYRRTASSGKLALDAGSSQIVTVEVFILRAHTNCFKLNTIYELSNFWTKEHL